MQSDQVAVGVEAGRALEHGDRPEEIMRHVFFPAPDQLDGDTGKFLGNGNGLMHVILCTAAPAEAAAKVASIHLAFLQR